MSQLSVTPELLTAAAADLEKIASTIDAAHLAVSPSVLSVAPAAADEVSTSIAHLFSGHAQDYLTAAGSAATYQDQFVQNLATNATSYASAEGVNTLALNLMEGLDAFRLGSSLALLAAAVGYVGLLYNFVPFLPAALAFPLYAPAGFLLVAAFANALFWSIVESGLTSLLGLA
ncbi:hypothetical protein A5634_04275 [Mycobacterium asiaticum]|uniref:PE domain-containing protein n=1 Tax=Mycobacterium asiaticum TaxID=1790 RepID=A0A1A3NSQ0_MYCAS|nr:PE family protein [Mycobacterium asiaticum]OBK24074.1 hypothetical protein A5634_04275 [Mycobacterium asiaticum]